MVWQYKGADGGESCKSGKPKDDTTPTQHLHDNKNKNKNKNNNSNGEQAYSYIQQSIEKDYRPQHHPSFSKFPASNTSSGPHVIYIVVDTCYPTAHSFETTPPFILQKRPLTRGPRR
jgi:hypothetical protein